MKRFAAAGLGQQSTALIVGCVLGMDGFPHLDAVGFSDTGDEQDATYAHRDRFKEWLEQRGVPLYTVKKDDPSGSLSQSIIDRLDQKRASASPIPLHLVGAGRALQGCTRDWKMRPLDALWKRLANSDPEVEICIGFGCEEIGRVKGETMEEWPEGWKARFPLIENGWNRGRSVAVNQEHLGWKIVPSMCKHCPHRRLVGPWSFARMQEQEPEEFARVVALEERVARDWSVWGMDGPGFLSEARRPLPEAIIEAKRQGTLWSDSMDMTCGNSPCWT